VHDNKRWKDIRVKLVSEFAMTNAACYKKKNLFTRKIGLKINGKSSKCYVLSTVFLWCSKLDTSERRSEIPGKVRNVVLEKNAEDQLERLCKKWKSITQSQGRKEYL